MPGGYGDRRRDPHGEQATLPRVRDDPKQKARQAVRDAQVRFEQDAEDVREARRRAFADAQAAGLSLREIAQETGLHHSTVAEVARGADS